MTTEDKATGRRQRGNLSLLAPVHLTGADNIARTFEVGRKTVLQWAREGAPIIYIGRKYQADYNKLWDWLIVNKRPGGI